MFKNIALKFHYKKTEIKGFLRSLKSCPETMKEPIDFVVTWVNDKDQSWLEEKNKYKNANTSGKSIDPSRYRDWNQFMYWFRAVEKYAPWVRKVFLVTCGHYPEWLNLNHEKLVLVKHSDFIPSEYLPTFSSHTIELNLHRIKGLSQHFVYFNDDVYLASPVSPEDFFINGLPKLSAVAYPLINNSYNGPFQHALFSNLGIINGNFNLKDCIEENPHLWFSYKYKGTIKFNRYAYTETNALFGMYYTHLGFPFLKSAFNEVWSKSKNSLDASCRHRFRDCSDNNHFIFTLWTIMSGNFIPVHPSYYGRKFGHISTESNEINKAFSNHNNKMICINDSVDVNENNFLETKKSIDKILKSNFSEKSTFEI